MKGPLGILYGVPGGLFRVYGSNGFLLVESGLRARKREVKAMAVNVLYYARGGGVTIEGSATGPTATQAQFCPCIKAKVVFGVQADVQALITHSWGLDASAPGYYDPEIQWYQISDNTSYAPSITFDVSNTNVVAVNKNATNEGITIIVILRRGSVGSGPWQ